MAAPKSLRHRAHTGAEPQSRHVRLIEHVDFYFPCPVALLLEESNGVAGHENPLTGVAHKLDGVLGDLIGILAVRSGLDDVEGMIPDP
jgi:hypothetical protein